MKTEQLLHNLQVPTGPIDVILDTDAFNEVDDQFALAYLLRSTEKLTVKAICAAPFLNSRSTSPADGMEKSYQEIKKVLALAGREDLLPVVYRGSTRYLPDETTPVESEGAHAIAALAAKYTPGQPLYVVAIGAITNVASAVLMAPEIINNIVVVWLGGHARHVPDTKEFNMLQDVAAARIIFGCGVPLVQLPCRGVVDHFTVSEGDLEKWLVGRNPLADYLAKNVICNMQGCANLPWKRVIWDVTAVGWLLNDGDRLMRGEIVPAAIPEYDFYYAYDNSRHPMLYITDIDCTHLLGDLFEKLCR